MDKKIVGAVIGVSVVLVVVGIFLAGRQPQTPLPSNPSSSDAKKTDLKLTDKDWSTGKSTAQVTLVEYGDYQCPACGAYHEVIKNVMSKMPDSVRLVFRHFPLVSIHDKAWTAAKYAEAAGKQGKFWDMHDALYESQGEWERKSVAEFEQYIETLATKAGVDVKKLKADVQLPEIEAKVKSDYDSANALNLNGTPTFFVNDVLIALPGSEERFEQILKDTLSVLPTPSAKVHEHADFALYANGRKFNLSNVMYDEKNPDIHIHDGNGEIIHKHTAGATMGTFISSLGIPVKPTVMYVNGKKYDRSWDGYSFYDLDQIVLSTTELAVNQITSVSDKACIYSEKCPERGKPPTENCVGGLDTPCLVEES